MTSEIQDALARHDLDGWLFFDHHHRDPLAYRILRLDRNAVPSRRWYYFVPATGSPIKLVHKIEAHVLDELAGSKETYSDWSEQQGKLTSVLENAGRVAMQYSPKCAIPYISNVDGGTLELVRSCGVDVVSSADLVQEFEARWSADQLETHLEAGRRVDQVRREAFFFAGERLRHHVHVTEYDVQKFILDRFEGAGLVTDHGPIVAVNQNASDPHYEPSVVKHKVINYDDVLLIDLWAKLTVPDAVYYDVTWTGFCGQTIPSPVQKIFEVARDARMTASNFVMERVEHQQVVFGWEVDDAARHFIAQHKLDEYFFHRTGHSIGTDVHGNGANMDNFESHDERRIIANTCFSIEPGIYLRDFGIRSEVNVYVANERALVTGEEQNRLVRILD